MNPFFASDLAASMHEERLARRRQERRVAEALRYHRAERLTRRAAILARRAADLVERSHR